MPNIIFAEYLKFMMLRNRNHPSRSILLILILLLSSLNSWSGKIYRPWRSTTAIVLAGESFEVWYNADASQSIEAVRLRGPYHSVQCTFLLSSGDWEVDPLSGNRYNSQITVNVPSDAPADRYDLVIETSLGEEISYGGVKVLKEYKSHYYIMHMSDGHLYQPGYDINTFMARKTAMINMANIMDCQLIIETGDNMYNVRNHPEREVMYFLGNEALGIKGMADASGATFLVPGDHDAHTSNDWPQASVQVNSDFFNDYWGLQNSNFIYGKGRFMMLNNAWAVSKTSAGDHGYQIDDARDWLSNEGSGGNFFVTAGHCYNKIHEFIDVYQELDLVLAGDKHHIRTDNPYSFNEGSPTIAYIAGSIRDHFEFNLFRVDEENGISTAVSGTNAVVEVLASGDQDNPETWEPNLVLEFGNDNDGRSYENTATIENKFGFPIHDARIRFIMPLGFEYKVTNGIISQEFDGDEFRVFDVSFDLEANSTTQINIGDADLCPDDPNKTEPGLCGCGIPEDSCETSFLVVNNGTGSGSYYPFETVMINAEEADENEEFDAWQIISGNPEIKNVYNPSTELRLLGEPAEIQATYKEKILINEAAFISQFIPPASQGEKVDVQITMKNTGTTTWTKHKGYQLGSQNPPGNVTWGLDRIDLHDSDSILSGEVISFNFQISVPETDSLYDFQWQMAQIDSSWFGEISHNQVIRNSLSNEYLDNCDSKSNWRTSGTISLDAVAKKQGSNCLSYTGSSADEFKRSFSASYNTKGSESGTILQFWYFVSDVSKLTGRNQVELGSSGKNDSNEYNWKLIGLRDGWNYIRLPIKNADKMGNPDLSAINWFRLYSFKSAQITTKIDGIQLLSDGIYDEVSLTVNKGSGNGDYEPGEQFLIQADIAPEGEEFDQWVIDAGDPYINNMYASPTTITLSESDAEITATYRLVTNLSFTKTASSNDFHIYPNPARDKYQIEFNIPEESRVSCAIYDLSGKKLRTVIDNRELEAGHHTFVGQVDGLEPGVYLQQFSSNNREVTKVLIIGEVLD